MINDDSILPGTERRSQWVLPVVAMVGTCLALVVFGVMFEIFIEGRYCPADRPDPSICNPWVTFLAAAVKAGFVAIAAFALVSMDVDLAAPDNRVRIAWITLIVITTIGLAFAIAAKHWDVLVAIVAGGVIALTRVRHRALHGIRTRNLSVSEFR
jgi:hypothetical protein